MSKSPSPLLGYNTNVRHKGRVFHIQTEDSGVQRPHVITHLFADGGRILKSTKTSYADKLEAVDWPSQVKKLMQDQHKAMFIALRDGQFDHLIDPNSTESSRTTEPSSVITTGPDASGPNFAVDGTGKANALVVPAAPAAARPASPASMAMSAVRTGGAAPPPLPRSVPGVAMQSPAAAAAATAATVSAAAPRAPGGAVAAAPAAPARSVAPTAPAPAAPAARPGNGAAPAAAVRSPAAPAPAGGPATSGGASAARGGRYGQVRSPDIFGSFRQKEGGGSIFGDELMSEKSLDEVILAYLAEDLDDKKR